MSAFVVGDKTISRVVYGLSTTIDPLLDNLTSVGQRLLEMNIEAVRQRYGHADQTKSDVAGYVYAMPDASDGSVHTYKAMQCLLYQCTEGNVPEQDLYKIVKQAKDWLGNELKKIHRVERVEDLPEYDTFPWGD
jgi:hypothetical protein